MAIVGRECEGIYPLVREFPERNRVEFLVFRVDRLIDMLTPFSSGKNAVSSFSLSYTTSEPSMWAARNRLSDPGIHFISETGVVLIIPWKYIKPSFFGNPERHNSHFYSSGCISEI